MNKGDVCLVDCVTTHTILQEKRYFLNLALMNGNVSTICGTKNLVEGFGRANIMLSNGIRFLINDVLYFSKSTRNLLNFKDIHKNGYQIETTNEGNIKCLYITFIVYDKKLVKKFSTFSSLLYHTNIKLIESYVVVN